MRVGVDWHDAEVLPRHGRPRSTATRWRMGPTTSASCQPTPEAEPRRVVSPRRATCSKLNSTPKTRLNINFCPFVSPDLFSSGTKCSNKSCRSIWVLQLFFKVQSLIRSGWRDTRLQSGVHENWNPEFSHPDLAKFWAPQNSHGFQL